MVTIEMVSVVALSFIVLVMCVQLILVQYGQGVVRAAVDEGALSGSRWSGSNDPSIDAYLTRNTCRDAADRVIGDVGILEATVTCAVTGSDRYGTGRYVTATAEATFDVPLLPGDWTYRPTATAVKERPPT